MDIVLLILRLVMAAVFGVAAVGKIFDPVGSEKAFADFSVPEIFRKPLVYLLPLAELLIAVSLLFVETSWFGAIGGAGLFLIFIGGMIYQMANGNAPDCHCFGQIHSEPVGISSILRNVGLLGIEVVLILVGRVNQGVSIVNTNQDIMQVVIGIAVIVLLAAVVYFLKRISEQQTQIMRRIELMELVSREGASVEREEVSHPHEGLPIGAQFPEFELPAVDGGTITLADLKDGVKPILFLFVCPTGTPCKAMGPEFEQWQKDLDEKVRLVFVSNGKTDANVEKFGGESPKQILLQKDRELAESVKAQWTPTAVLMDAGGRVASHATAGDTAIRALIEQIKSEDLGREFTHFSHGHDHGHTPNKIGSSVPQFSLEDIKGHEITSDYFKGKKTLVTFWSLTCPFCTTMMEELKAWDKAKGKDDPALVIFSEGDKAAHEEFELRSPVILDEGYKTASGFGMFGTPSAVLVNEDGKIVSETAVGAADIWSLVGKK